MEFLRRVVRAARVEGPLDPRWARPNPARMPAVPAVLVAQPIASFTERPSRRQDRTGERACMAVRGFAVLGGRRHSEPHQTTQVGDVRTPETRPPPQLIPPGINAAP